MSEAGSSLDFFCFVFCIKTKNEENNKFFLISFISWHNKVRIANPDKLCFDLPGVIWKNAYPYTTQYCLHSELIAESVGLSQILTDSCLRRNEGFVTWIIEVRITNPDKLNYTMPILKNTMEYCYIIACTGEP